MWAVKRAFSILLATIALATSTMRLCEARIIPEKSASASTHEPSTNTFLSFPDKMPQGLYPGEYLMLAEHYIATWNYKEAAKCILKVKQLAFKSSLEQTAIQLEKYHLFDDAQFQKWLKVEAVKSKDDRTNSVQYVIALKQFLVEYPNCELAQEELYNALTPSKEKSECRNRLTQMDPVAYPQEDAYVPDSRDFTEIVALPYFSFKKFLEIGSLFSSNEQKEKSGFIDHSGKFVFHIESPLRSGEEFCEGFLIGYLRRFLDSKGNEVQAPECSSILHLSEGLAPIKIGDYWGFVDARGAMILEPRWRSVLWFKEGLAPVKVNNKWGYIDKKGVLVIEPRFANALCFNEGRAVVTINKKIGYIDKTGKLVIPAKFDAGESFSNGLCKVFDFETPLKRIHEYYIDKNANVVFDLSKFQLRYNPYGENLKYASTANLACDTNFLVGYDHYSNPDCWNLNRVTNEENRFNDDRLCVEVNNMFGYVDTRGNLAIPCKFYKARTFSEGLAAVSTNAPQTWTGLIREESFGFIDKSGKIVIPMKYRKVGDFHEGLAYVEITEGVGGFIDTTGRLVIQFEGESTRFNSGLAPVEWSNLDYPR